MKGKAHALDHATPTARLPSHQTRLLARLVLVVSSLASRCLMILPPDSDEPSSLLI